jgi:mediator of RNA polymerase II transcription subunit 17
MSHAKDLLVSLLATPQPLLSEPAPTPSYLSASIVSKPPPIVSVQAFDAQLTIGSKDEALRKAADVFKTAASGMERTRVKDEKYWVDALKVRRCNWGLVPAPLPFGAPTGKGADKTSKDFLISYGLEECLSSFLFHFVETSPLIPEPSSCLIPPTGYWSLLKSKFNEQLTVSSSSAYTVAGLDDNRQ